MLWGIRRENRGEGSQLRKRVRPGGRWEETLITGFVQVTGASWVQEAECGLRQPRFVPEGVLSSGPPLLVHLSG